MYNMHLHITQTTISSCYDIVVALDILHSIKLQSM